MIIHAILGRRSSSGGEAITWTARSWLNTTDTLRGIDCSSSYCFITGEDTSVNGISGYASDPTSTWTSKNHDTSGLVYSCRYGNKWATASDGKHVYTATDPTGTWTDRTYPLGNDVPRALYYDGTYWFCGGGGGSTGHELQYTTDIDGSWTDWSPSGGSTVNGIAWNTDKNIYVCVMNSGYMYRATSVGGTWSNVTSSFGSSHIIRIAYGGSGIFVAVGYSGKIATSTDGSTWTQRTSGVSTSLRGVAYGNGGWVVVGDGPTLLTATDPTGTWTSRSSGVSSDLNNVHYDSNRDLFIAIGDNGVITTAQPGV